MMRQSVEVTRTPIHTICSYMYVYYIDAIKDVPGYINIIEACSALFLFVLIYSFKSFAWVTL